MSELIILNLNMLSEGFDSKQFKNHADNRDSNKGGKESKLSAGERLYNLHFTKNKVHPVRKQLTSRTKAVQEEEICITIPLKGGQGVSLRNAHSLGPRNYGRQLSQSSAGRVCHQVPGTPKNRAE